MAAIDDSHAGRSASQTQKAKNESCLVAVMRYYRKRGSASYIVREVLSVRERDTDRERERQRRK